MAKETKVIHVHLIFKKTSRFFGSISAIYSEFTAEEIGITEETLRHKGLSDGLSFAFSICLSLFPYLQHSPPE